MRPVRDLTDAEIGVVFQPIVEIATGRLFAHEALVRCTRPEYAQPPVLFEHAVKDGATGRLGRKIRDAAFSTCGDVPLFINLHPEELAARWLVRPDDPIGFHKRQVYLEITESATIEYFDLCQSVLKELCVRTNARLVIDDFGAGYSNLERLIVLNPAVVKLDLALTRDIHKERRKQIVTRHMLNLCKDLGATVVAEGVETLEELECIRDLGVDYAQGYLLARPATPPPSFVWPLKAKGPPSPRPPEPSGSLRAPASGGAPMSARSGPPPLPPRKVPPPLPVAVGVMRPQAPPAPRRSPSGRPLGAAPRRSKPPPDKSR
jgi:EAL domain-containing protein (putative c-di-GMP-specific phosphodiesterase class I)